MPIKFNDEAEGDLLVIQASGKLTKADYVYFAPEFDRLVRLNGKIRVLFDMTDFHGWEAGGLWEDTKFALKHCADIARLAMVGDKQWEHGMATICQPFTTAKIKYFEQTQQAQARAWLKEAVPSSV